MAGFRQTLTIWNTVVLAVALAATSGLMVGLTRHWSSKVLDDELLERAQRFSGPRGPRGQGGQPGSQMGQPAQQLGGATIQRFAPEPGQNRDPFMPGGSGNGQGRRGPGPGDIRFPRRFTLDGVNTDPNRNEEPWDKALIARSKQGEVVFKTIQHEGRGVRIVSTPVGPPGGPPDAVVQAATDLQAIDSVSRAQVLTLAWVLPSTLLLAALGGLFLTKRAMKPISDVTSAASQIDDSQLDKRLTVAGDDELAQLAAQFNAMLARLQTAVDNRDNTLAAQSQMIEAQKRFASDASHELRTPLARIKLATSSTLGQSADEDDYKHALGVVDKASDDMDVLIGQMLTLARLESQVESGPMSTVAVSDIVDNAVSRSGLSNDKRIKKSVPKDAAKLSCHQDMLERALMNLLSNAARHTPQDGEIKVSATVIGGALDISVADTGEGIGPEHLPHVIERFYRVDTARSRAEGGTGLGLAIVEQAARAHGGTLKLESTVGEGTTATISLPYASTGEVPAEPNNSQTSEL